MAGTRRFDSRLFFLNPNAAGRAWWDAFKLKLPVLGPLFHKLALSRFARTTSSLIHSGVPILEVLNVVSSTVNNVQMEAALRSSALRIERGETLSGALSTYPIFPAIILRMITAGEQGGAVDTMLEKVSDYMDEELDQALAGLTSLIEPILIIFLGVMIGGMVLAMLLPGVRHGQHVPDFPAAGCLPSCFRAVCFMCCKGHVKPTDSIWQKNGFTIF
jgi:type IV pilus assembly protein PilC